MKRQRSSTSSEPLSPRTRARTNIGTHQPGRPTEMPGEKYALGHCCDEDEESGFVVNGKMCPVCFECRRQQVAIIHTNGAGQPYDVHCLCLVCFDALTARAFVDNRPATCPECRRPVLANIHIDCDDRNRALEEALMHELSVEEQARTERQSRGSSSRGEGTEASPWWVE